MQRYFFGQVLCFLVFSLPGSLFLGRRVPHSHVSSSPAFISSEQALVKLRPDQTTFSPFCAPSPSKKWFAFLIPPLFSRNGRRPCVRLHAGCDFWRTVALRLPFFARFFIRIRSLCVLRRCRFALQCGMFQGTFSFANYCTGGDIISLPFFGRLSLSKWPPLPRTPGPQ